MSWTLLWCFGFIYSVEAQDIMRLEIEASNLSVPYYTIPLADHGIVVVRGGESRNRRISSWELIHFDIAFREVHRQTIDMERGGYFSGWKADKGHVYLLFLNDQPLTSGEVLSYTAESRRMIRKPFSLGDRSIAEPVFRASGDQFFLLGLHQPRRTMFRKAFASKERADEMSRLIAVSGTTFTDSLTVSEWAVRGLRQIIHAAGSPADESMLVALAIDSTKQKRFIQVVAIPQHGKPLIDKGKLPLSADLYLSDLTFVSTHIHPLACAGTYGSKDKRSWNSTDPITVQGFFFAPLNTDVTTSVRTYPLTKFRQSITNPIQINRSGSRSGRGSNEIRMLIHPRVYKQNDHLILVGETFYPEYEYENRAQQFYMPYSYYGYYPGFYDSGGRWVFTGFRYRNALVIALDAKGDLMWENGIETSNILDKQLMTRLSLMSYADELVLVYAHDGRIWFRVIRGSEVLVDKESYPVELSAPGDKIRENIAMNMARWYDNYFLVWGRQTIRNADGRNRTVYFCNKLAFE